MKVKTLINKLNKMPQDAEVVIPNNDNFFNGEYTATLVEESLNNTVLIGSSHKKLVNEYDF